MIRKDEDVRELCKRFAFRSDDPSQVQELIEQDLPRFLELFISRSREYGDDNKFVLGSRGQFADMWRKFGKLKTGIWEGNETQLTSESVDEILMDLLGHCFLTLQCRRKEGLAAEGAFRGEDVPEPKEEEDEFSLQELQREVSRHYSSTPLYILNTLTKEQMLKIIRHAQATSRPRDWDRIMKGDRDGQPNYDLAEDDLP